MRSHARLGALEHWDRKATAFPYHNWFMKSYDRSERLAVAR
jgi:hypothetical protein